MHSTKLLFDILVIRQKLSTKCRSRRSVVRRSVAHRRDISFNYAIDTAGRDLIKQCRKSDDDLFFTDDLTLKKYSVVAECSVSKNNKDKFFSLLSPGYILEKAAESSHAYRTMTYISLMNEHNKHKNICSCYV